MSVFGQDHSSCDTIYSDVDTMPSYGQGDFQEMYKYFMNEFFPVIGSCMKQEKTMIASISIILTIDQQGKVIDATFPKPEITASCKENLKNKLLTMNGWKPAKKNGQPVCCYVSIPISCIKWG